ncbi:tetratricopeptide repeat-containing sensor histidine kinase [Gelidibacter maritimus]|uniref:histidine kinase n=1 Tax=Gelidibacter maritimus TaxID=2761487 RepID=A0A7W2R4I8_9FLAO|nr:tetratricopeptide repeat-containing sensor histidine kinase [Gelidibacter maritimus]MBA6153145.1 two-component sensor histidine kinase [Gelidibacter maritimus]
MFRLNLLIVLFLFGAKAYSQKILESPEYDSILKFQSLSKNNELSLSDQFAYAKKAVDYANALKVDSVIIKANHNYSLLSIYIGNFDEFKRINFKTLKLSKSINDSLAMAIANHNLGWYHHQNRIQNDSAYFYYTKAYKISEQLELTSRQVEILINISEIQDLEKDYIGSEESAIEAIKLAKHLPEDEYLMESLWLLYTRLGTGATTMKIFEKALEYHETAYGIAKKMKEGFILQLSSENNLAHVHKEMGNYKKALSLYEGILNYKELFDLEPDFYALVLDNVAYARYLNGSKDFEQMEQMFERAYHISDSLNDQVTKLYVTIDLSEFYKGRGLEDQALKYAEESYHLATDISSNDILLESMVLLSELKPGDEGKVYLKEHIKLSDSLLAHERSIRNKFARIEFETDQIELENKRIATEKLWWTISSIVLLVASALVYIIITQRNKNKALKFKQDQQLANEEIYNLMLSQQDKVDGARAEEKRRISQELHDGVLGRLFGARLSLDSYNLNDGKEAAQVRSKYISELKIIEEDIRKISHDLNTDFVAGSKFMDILKVLIKEQCKAYQLMYDFDYTHDIDWDLVSNKVKINIYRMLQESLQNIYKHANAKTVKISIELKKSVICLLINDDGTGFDPNKSKKGIGLKNIKSRVDELNGTVVFQSKINQGTTIKVKIPYTP